MKPKGALYKKVHPALPFEFLLSKPLVGFCLATSRTALFMRPIWTHFFVIGGAIDNQRATKIKGES
ncbi:MAG: hypothetical protein IJU56_09990 [Clostridia bacterium]|nr:hypothetical protein [Clostridia bacterium]